MAQALGASRDTVRRAINNLIERGLLNRAGNGRLTVNPSGPGPTIALLVPSLVSPDVDRWRVALERLGLRYRAGSRMMMYQHWHDPVVLDALNHSAAVVIYPSSEPLPEHLEARLIERRQRVLIIDSDWTQLDITCIQPHAPGAVAALVDHLAGGERSPVDCFNVQSLDPVIDGRIAAWDKTREQRGLTGRLLGEPIEVFGRPLASAYQQYGELLASGQAADGALLCTTLPAAMGAIRAMADVGVRAGADVPVAVVNDEGMGPYLCPTLTALEPSDAEALLEPMMGWLSDAAAVWTGPPLVQPADVRVRVGESSSAGLTSDAAAGPVRATLGR